MTYVDTINDLLRAHGESIVAAMSGDWDRSRACFELRDKVLNQLLRSLDGMTQKSE